VGFTCDFCFFLRAEFALDLVVDDDVGVWCHQTGGAAGEGLVGGRLAGCHRKDFCSGLYDGSKRRRSQVTDEYSSSEVFRRG